MSTGAANYRFTETFKVSKRAGPTMSIYNASLAGGTTIRNYTAVSSVAYTVGVTTERLFNISPSSPVNENLYAFHWTADAEL